MAQLLLLHLPEVPRCLLSDEPGVRGFGGDQDGPCSSPQVPSLVSWAPAQAHGLCSDPKPAELMREGGLIHHDLGWTCFENAEAAKETLEISPVLSCCDRRGLRLGTMNLDGGWESAANMSTRALRRVISSLREASPSTASILAFEVATPSAVDSPVRFRRAVLERFGDKRPQRHSDCLGESSDCG